VIGLILINVYSHLTHHPPPTHKMQQPTNPAEVMHIAYTLPNGEPVYHPLGYVPSPPWTCECTTQNRGCDGRCESAERVRAQAREDGLIF
jgi:hypothetical protein